ncbi:MAG: long-chain fatty acid--CoA ligase [Ruminococcaceae bacterium]|nr:long-chain fatty acid--CoA ligase [Oscillospiraceae bacterium]
MTEQEKKNFIMKYKKTERIYTPVESMAHFATKIGKFGDKTAYRYFDRQHNLLSITYKNLSAKFLQQAAGYAAAGLAGKRIAVIGETSVEWVSSYVAAIAAGGVAVPMDRELAISEIEGFLAFAEVDAIVYSHTFNDKFENLAKNHPTVKTLIPMAPEKGAPVSDRILPYATLMEMGEEAVKNGYAYPATTDTDRMVEMLFTSGTTGSSKCVMLSEKNIMSVVNAACESVNFSADDSIVSVLPIHHTYELAIMLAALNYGMNVAINDSLKRVLKNFATFKPTGLVLVPLFVSTMHKKIWEEAKKGKKDKILRSMTRVSRVMRHVNIDVRDTLFKQVKAAFGGRLCKIVCGGAPLNPELFDTFSELGMDISEGYGITECAPLIAVSPYYAPKKGSVGPAVPCCTVRIDSDYQNDKGFYEGEIQVKGDNVMLGYYKNPVETAKVFTEDGWFCTGDVGYMDQEGYIFITGRKKNVIVLENGKNVFPEEIEEYLGQLDAIAECVVLGRKMNAGSDEITLTALVYPQMDKFDRNADHAVIEEAVRAQINKMNHKLVSYKQIRNVEFRYEPFEKTTSKKIKRHLIK